MNYVDSNLMDSETVVYKARIHWLIFVPGACALIAGVILYNTEEFGPLLGGIVFLFGSLSIVKALVAKLTTELAVTSKRVIAKTGLIRRNTAELNHSKVESFHVEQGIVDRILGAGTVVINGTGGGKTPIPNIDEPLEFRRQAMQAIDASQ